MLPLGSVSADPTELSLAAVGAGARGQDGTIFPMNVSVGDKVLLPEYGGTTVKIEEEELTLFKEMELLGKYS